VDSQEWRPLTGPGCHLEEHVCLHSGAQLLHLPSSPLVSTKAGDAGLFRYAQTSWELVRRAGLGLHSLLVTSPLLQPQIHILPLALLL
jgi:hypothetical protein